MNKISLILLITFFGFVGFSDELETELDKFKIHKSMIIYSKNSELIENNSKNDSLYLFIERALLNIEKGNLKEAKKDLETVLSISPNNREAYYNLGLIYHSLDEYSKSQDAYHKVIQSDIKDHYFIDANYNLAIMFMYDLKDYKNALNPYLIEVVRADPNHYMGYFRMAICYQTLGDIRHAEQYYRKTLESNPDFKEATDKLNKLLSDNEKYK